MVLQLSSLVAFHYLLAFLLVFVECNSTVSHWIVSGRQSQKLSHANCQMIHEWTGVLTKSKSNANELQMMVADNFWCCYAQCSIHVAELIPIEVIQDHNPSHHPLLFFCSLHACDKSAQSNSQEEPNIGIGLKHICLHFRVQWISNILHSGLQC